MSDKSKTFCMHPFTGLATREDGAIKICCRSLPIGWIQNESLESAWNNDKMLSVRKQILNDERPDVCTPCFDLEDQGVESLRQRHIQPRLPESRIVLYPNQLNQLNDDYTMPFEFPTMEIKLNNLCNLRCRMCNPLDSTSWQDWNSIVEFYKKENNYLVPTVEKLVDKPGQYIGPFDDSDNWWNSFEKLIPHFKRVEFAGGEPLMDPQHYKILDMLKPYAKNIEIKYATNGTTLGISKNRTIFDYWPHFRSVAVNVSIDGIHDVYEHIRGNGDFSEVVRNIQEIKKLPNISRIVGAFTAQAGNMLQITDCIRYFIDELGIHFYSHRVSYPKLLSAQVLPQPLKDLCIERLTNLYNNIDTIKNIDFSSYSRGITLQQINDNINYLKAVDQNNLWNDYIEFNRRLDDSRKCKTLLEVVPEFKPYV